MVISSIFSFLVQEEEGCPQSEGGGRGKEEEKEGPERSKGPPGGLLHLPG